MDLKDCKIYLVTDEKACLEKDFYSCIEEAIKGGVKIVQLREKNISTKDFYEKALKVKEICKNYGVLFIINDRLDIAQIVKADGVHLGQSDMPIEKAREILKDKFSCERQILFWILEKRATILFRIVLSTKMLIFLLLTYTKWD